jgi:sterol desaturase/sphingolipid hydroxylase (fatty acid hydroxylase superfamily)
MPPAFRFVRPQIGNHLLTGALLGLALLAGAAGPVQAAWAALVGALPPAALVVGGLWLVHALVFWPTVALFSWVDRHDSPAFVARHRIQAGPRRQPPPGRALRVVLTNQLLLSPPLLGLLHLGLVARGWTPSPAVPGPLQVLLELGGMGAAAVAVFYTTHRLLHRPALMRAVHRVHHEFRTSTALASEHAHPVEFVLGNFLTLSAGVLVFGPSLWSVYLFTVLAMLTVLVHHSGYALPWAPWSVHHDWHHHRVVEAFGTLGIEDRLLGTSPELDRRLADLPGDGAGG